MLKKKLFNAGRAQNASRVSLSCHTIIQRDFHHRDLPNHGREKFRNGMVELVAIMASVIGAGNSMLIGWTWYCLCENDFCWVVCDIVDGDPAGKLCHRNHFFQDEEV